MRRRRRMRKGGDMRSGLRREHFTAHSDNVGSIGTIRNSSTPHTAPTQHPHNAACDWAATGECLRPLAGLACRTSGSRFSFRLTA